MITVYTRSGASIEVANGAAVVAVNLPTRGTGTPPAGLAVVARSGERLAIFRQAEVAGYDLSQAGAS